MENGRAALAALDAADFDLLVTDCHMPEIDGVALTGLIRAAEAGRGARRMPILGLTADVTAVMRARGLGAGMNDCRTKPAALDQLRAAVAKLLRIAGGAPGASGGGAGPAILDGPRVDGPRVDGPRVDRPVVDRPVVGDPALEALAVDAPGRGAATLDSPIAHFPMVASPAVDTSVFDPSAYRDLFDTDEAEVWSGSRPISWPPTPCWMSCGGVPPSMTGRRSPSTRTGWQARPWPWAQ